MKTMDEAVDAAKQISKEADAMKRELIDLMEYGDQSAAERLIDDLGSMEAKIAVIREALTALQEQEGVDETDDEKTVRQDRINATSENG